MLAFIRTRNGFPPSKAANLKKISFVETSSGSDLTPCDTHSGLVINCTKIYICKHSSFKRVKVYVRTKQKFDF